MYRLLIVDDEPIIADSLLEVFQNLKQPELDVYRVYSGNEALDMLRSSKIDIVLTDIRMPGIDGLQLLEHIHSSWPQCRVILLTGYNDFEYVYKAIQYPGVSYLLKTEGYDKVIGKVEETAAEIEKSFIMEDILNKANQQLELTSALLRKEYFTGLLKGEVRPEEIDGEQFSQLGIALDADRPVLMLLGRVDNFPQSISYTAKSRSLLSVKLIAEQLLSHMSLYSCITDESGDLVWFLQHKGPSSLEPSESMEQQWERLKVFVRGTLETIQASCQSTLGLSVSFAMGTRPAAWHETVKEFAFHKQLLDYRIGSGSGMLLVDENLNLNESIRDSMQKVQQLQAGLKKTGILNICLERGKRDEFHIVLNEIAKPMYEVESMHYNPSLEVFYSISLMFLSYINRWNLTETVAFTAGISGLTNVGLHKSWKEAVEYFRDLADAIFRIQDKEQEKRAADAVEKLCRYVDENINKELSLVKLADLVYFNPAYLSRLFKQVTGKNLSHYILDRRLEKARQMLESPDMKIHDIAETVGYTTAQNFTRIFKKITGTTPQEYRDSCLKGKEMRGL